MKDSRQPGAKSIPVHPGNPTRRWLNAGEAAAYLGLSRNTVARLVRRGELPGQRIGKQYFIPRDALERIGYEQEDDA